MGGAGQRDPNGPLFFVHVMKTGGTTFELRMKRQLGREAVFPYMKVDPADRMPNLSLDYLREQPPERLAQVRAFTGHFPFFATELVPTPSLVMTVLRDPVERAISYLKQHQLHMGQAHRTLEEIYERGNARPFHIENYQVRVFASTVSDGVESVLQRLPIDQRRMEIAKQHLRQVDVLGLTERYDEFIDAVLTRLGWPPVEVPNQRVSDYVEVPQTLRQRIAADNAADLEFYEYARQLYAERRRAAR